jgi:hypothetical protein
VYGLKGMSIELIVSLDCGPVQSDLVALFISSISQLEYRESV